MKELYLVISTGNSFHIPEIEFHTFNKKEAHKFVEAYGPKLPNHRFHIRKIKLESRIKAFIYDLQTHLNSSRKISHRLDRQ